MRTISISFPKPRRKIEENTHHPSSILLPPAILIAVKQERYGRTACRAAAKSPNMGRFAPPTAGRSSFFSSSPLGASIFCGYIEDASGTGGHRKATIDFEIIRASIAAIRHGTAGLEADRFADLLPSLLVSGSGGWFCCGAGSRAARPVLLRPFPHRS